MLPATNGAAPFTEQGDWQIIMCVGVTVGNPATIHDHAMIQKRSVCFGYFTQPIQKVMQQGNVVLVDLADFLLFGKAVPVVRQVMVPFLDAQIAVTAVATRVGIHECGHPSRIGLKRQYHHIEQQFHVFGVFSGDAFRPGKIGDVDFLLFKLVRGIATVARFPAQHANTPKAFAGRETPSF